MGSLLKIFILFSLFSYTSCHYLMPSCTDGFEIYKKPVIIPSTKSLKLNNGFYSRSINSNSGRFLFSNGKTKSAMFGNGNNLSEFTNKENWADYFINGDTLIIQGFNHHNQELCRRWVIETKGLITSDTTILLLSTYDYRFKTTEVFDPPTLLSFISSSIRPDSTVAWYQNKSWFINNVHSSRK